MENNNDNGAQDIVIEDQDIADLPDLTDEDKNNPDFDWKAHAEKMAGIARRRTTSLKKIKDGLGTKQPKDQQQPKPKEGELDYGQKAFLISSGIKTEEEFAFVSSAMKDSGKSLDDVLKSPFLQGELKRIREEVATKAAIPGREDAQGQPARDSVEYWLNKGELPPLDQPELRQKVVNAKIAKEKNKSQFTSNPVVGQA